MDPNRRQQLEARKKALQEKLASPLHESPITIALRARGVAFEMSHVGLWTPAYLGISSSRIDWGRSPPPADQKEFSTLSDRVSVARSFLDRVAEPGDRLHFYYEYHNNGFDIMWAEAESALDLLMDSEHEIWITARPKNWLIEFDFRGNAKLAMPPELSPDEAEAIAVRQKAYVAPLADPLCQAGVAVTLYTRGDPSGPAAPRGAVMYRWNERKRTVGLPLHHGDCEGLAARLRDFLSRHAPETEALALDLGLDEAPIVVAPTGALIDRPEAMMALLEHPLPGAEERRAREFFLFPNDGSWAVRVVADGPRWKVESTAWSGK